MTIPVPTGAMSTIKGTNVLSAYCSHDLHQPSLRVNQISIMDEKYLTKGNPVICDEAGDIMSNKTELGRQILHNHTHTSLTHKKHTCFTHMHTTHTIPHACPHIHVHLCTQIHISTHICKYTFTCMSTHMHI